MKISATLVILCVICHFIEIRWTMDRSMTLGMGIFAIGRRFGLDWIVLTLGLVPVELVGVSENVPNSNQCQT